jgi:hypothetical protein
VSSRCRRPWPRTASIEREIASRLGAETRSAPTDAEVIDAVRNLHSSNTLDGIVQKHVDGLWKEARRTWVAAYNHLRVQHEFQGRPVFLAGGGSRLPHVAVTFARPWVPNFKRQTTRDLPVPRDFEVPAGRQAPFYRLSVAHGLAIPKPELGEYVLPKDAPDQTPVRTFAAPIEALGDQQPG